MSYRERAPKCLNYPDSGSKKILPPELLHRNKHFFQK